MNGFICFPCSCFDSVVAGIYCKYVFFLGSVIKMFADEKAFFIQNSCPSVCVKSVQQFYGNHFYEHFFFVVGYHGTCGLTKYYLL